ncbi:hypothetical protein [Pseudomonas sp. MYb371]
MNIMLPGHRPLLAPSAVVQACQRLGSGGCTTGLQSDAEKLA